MASNTDPAWTQAEQAAIALRRAYGLYGWDNADIAMAACPQRSATNRPIVSLGTAMDPDVAVVVAEALTTYYERRQPPEPMGLELVPPNGRHEMGRTYFALPAGEGWPDATA